MAELFMECEEEELEPWQQMVDSPDDDDDEVECVEPTSPPATPTPPPLALPALTRTVLAVPSTSAAAGVPVRSPTISVNAPSVAAASSSSGGIMGAPAMQACLPVPTANPITPLTFGMLSTTGQNVLTLPTLTRTIAQGQNTYLLAPGYILNGMGPGTTVRSTQGPSGHNFVIQLQGGTQLPVMAAAPGQQALHVPTMVQVPAPMLQAERPRKTIAQRLNIPVPVRLMVPPKTGLPQVVQTQGSTLFPTVASSAATSSAKQLVPVVGAAPVNLLAHSTVMDRLRQLPRLPLKRGPVAAPPVTIDAKRMRNVVSLPSYAMHTGLPSIPIRATGGGGLTTLSGTGGQGAAVSMASPVSEYDKMDNRAPIPKGCPKCNLHFNILDVLKRHMKVCCPEQLAATERSEMSGIQLHKPPVVSPNKPSPQKLLFSEGRLIMLVDDFYYGRAEGTRKHLDSNAAAMTPFKCYSCAKVLKNNIRFMNHMKHHMELERQSNESWDSHTNCQHCFRQFPTPFQLQCHIESAHSACDAPTKCKICELNFDHEQMLLQHMKENHKPGEMPYVCQVCNFRSSVYAEVDSHFRAEHENTKSLLCPFCLKVIKSANGYLQHFMRHQNKGVFRCSKCRLQFLSKKDKMDHKTNHHKTHRKPRQLYGLTPGTKVTIRASLTTELLASANESMAPASSSAMQLPARTADGAFGQLQQQQHQAFMRNMGMTKPASCFSGRPKGSFQRCVECRLEVKDFVSHFPTYVHCSFCRYSTSCSRAFAEHMISIHTTRKPRFNMYKSFLWQMRGHVLACTCGVSHSWQSFDVMAKHLLSFPEHYCHLEISAEEFKDDMSVRRKRTNLSLYDDARKAGFIRSLSLSQSRPGAAIVPPKSSDEVIVLDSDSDTELTEVSVTPTPKATSSQQQQQQEEESAVPKLRISLGFLKPRGGVASPAAARAGVRSTPEPLSDDDDPRPSVSPATRAEGSCDGDGGTGIDGGDGEDGGGCGDRDAGNEETASAAAPGGETEGGDAVPERDGGASETQQQQQQQQQEEDEGAGGITGTIEEGEEEPRGSPVASEDEEAGLEGCCESDDDVAQREDGDGANRRSGADMADNEEEENPRYSPISDASQVDTDRGDEEEEEEQDTRSGFASDRDDRDGEEQEEGLAAQSPRDDDAEEHGDEEGGRADGGDGEEAGGDAEGWDRSEAGGEVDDEPEGGHGDVDGDEGDELGGTDVERDELGGTDVERDELGGTDVDEGERGGEEDGDGEDARGDEGEDCDAVGRDVDDDDEGEEAEGELEDDVDGDAGFDAEEGGGDLGCDVNEGEGGDVDEQRGESDEEGGDADEELGVDGEHDADEEMGGDADEELGGDADDGDADDGGGDGSGNGEEELGDVNADDVRSEGYGDVDEDVGEQGGDADEEAGDADEEAGDAEDQDGEDQGGDDAGGDDAGQDGEGEGGAGGEGGEGGGPSDEEGDSAEGDAGIRDHGEGRAGSEEQEEGGDEDGSDAGTSGGQARGELEPLTPSEVLEQEASRILHADRKAETTTAAVVAPTTGNAGPARPPQPLAPGTAAIFKSSTVN